jgi:hypothetical protein
MILKLSCIQRLTAAEIKGRKQALHMTRIQLKTYITNQENTFAYNKIWNRSTHYSANTTYSFGEGQRHWPSILTHKRQKGRAIAQAVSRWLPTPAARVPNRFWSSGICDGQSGAEVGFLRILRFPLPISIPPIAPQSPSPIIWGWYNRPEVAAVQGT